MDLISDYRDKTEESEKTLVAKTCAPQTNADEEQGLAATDSDMKLAWLRDSLARKVQHNMPVHVMHAPQHGPLNPNEASNMNARERNHWAGQAEDAYMNSYSFEDQFHGFATSGTAADPATGLLVGAPTHGATLSEERAMQEQRRKKQKIEKKGRGYLDRPFVLQSRQPWADKVLEVADEFAVQERKHELDEPKMEHHEPSEISSKDNYSIFHGKESEDYQGRSWLEPGPFKPEAGSKCFLPKRPIHSWTGHTRGVNSIHFYPKSGHLLLSAGLDGRAKIWRTTGERECMRTYIGHVKGIRDCCFADSGNKFVTAAYDKKIKLWDTETGAMLFSFGDGNVMAYTVKTHPGHSHPDVLLAGLQNKKIVQYDMRSGDVVQEYDYHLGPVNTITFIDDNRRFLSTSGMMLSMFANRGCPAAFPYEADIIIQHVIADDKSIRVWEFGVPVQAKAIADPTMHAISAAALSANGKWWIGQSADNTIVTYHAGEKVYQNKKKTFTGHSSAGYACQIGMSHDDQFVYSGDGEGKMYIWDWKTKKIVRSMKAHVGVCMGCEWHPVETSKVATCGWDGIIKYWD